MQPTTRSGCSCACLKASCWTRRLIILLAVVGGVLFPSCVVMPLMASSFGNSPEQLPIEEEVTETLDTRVVVFVRVTNQTGWNKVESCLGFVADAVDGGNIKVDITLKASWPGDVDDIRRFEKKHANAIVQINEANSASLMQPAWEALRTSRFAADTALQIDTDVDSRWMDLSLQSLCGSKSQVVSVFNNFANNSQLGLIAPLGMLLEKEMEIQAVSPYLADIFPELQAWLQRRAKSFAESFASLNREVFQQPVFTAVVGNSFWMHLRTLRHSLRREDVAELEARNGPQALEAVKRAGGDSDTSFSGKADAFCEGSWLLASAVSSSGLRIAQLAPAPKVFAMYFPQFHTFPENDRNWGKGFTEWTLLRPYQAPDVRKPLNESLGGLGYYDLTSRQTRQRQAEFAKKYGIHGFAMYHYWFTGADVVNETVMWRIPHLMQQDGEPNVPFFFTWANEPWSRKWDGGNKDVLIAQSYGDKDNWKKHFLWLLPYFRDPRYMKTTDGKPLFAIYRPRHMLKKVKPMLDLWTALAQEFGFAGIYYIETVTGQKRNIPQLQLAADVLRPLFDACLHFVAGIGSDLLDGRAATAEDLPLCSAKRQFWGANNGFDNGVRKSSTFYLNRPFPPPKFRDDMSYAFARMSSQPQNILPDNLFFITSWNEWNEQSVLEPDDVYHFQYLEAVQWALEHVEAHVLL